MQPQTTPHTNIFINLYNIHIYTQTFLFVIATIHTTHIHTYTNKYVRQTHHTYTTSKNKPYRYKTHTHIHTGTKHTHICYRLVFLRLEAGADVEEDGAERFTVFNLGLGRRPACITNLRPKGNWVSCAENFSVRFISQNVYFL